MALEEPSTTETGGRLPIVTFANRLPVRRIAGGWRPSDGGLVAALRPALDERDATWVGWEPAGGGVPSRVPGLDLTLRAVVLSRAVVKGSYHGFANRTLWPLLHGLIEQPVFEPRWWDAYRLANLRFADQDPRHEGVRWIHDYHLMLLPNILRERQRRGPIGFFLHVPFPPPEIFSRLPWRHQLLLGLLGADVVSFHTPADCENFRRSCIRCLPDVTVRPGCVELSDGRVVRTASNPISIDARTLGERATSRQVDRRLADLRTRFEGRRLILGIDRLDYTKGIPERLRALELLFEVHPGLQRTVSFVQIAVPSRGEIQEYEDLRATVERLVGRINGRFTERHAVPVHYLYRSVPIDELLAYYRLADICLVTPLNDGMNLVAKEYAAVQGHVGGDGVLVLSEFAGAAAELREALPCNPYDIEGLAGTIALALELPADDRVSRIAALARKVVEADVHHWFDREMAHLEQVGAESRPPWGAATGTKGAAAA